MYYLPSILSRAAMPALSVSVDVPYSQRTPPDKDLEQTEGATSLGNPSQKSMRPLPAPEPPRGLTERAGCPPKNDITNIVLHKIYIIKF